MDFLGQASIVALASILVCVLPLAMGIVYAIWPTERRLMLVRSLSLATVFSAVAGAALGFINAFRFIGENEATSLQPLAIGAAESLVPLFFGFGCLTVTWLCVTIGLWRRA